MARGNASLTGIWRRFSIAAALAPVGKPVLTPTGIMAGAPVEPAAGQREARNEQAIRCVNNQIDGFLTQGNIIYIIIQQRKSIYKLYADKMTAKPSRFTYFCASAANEGILGQP